MTQKICKLARVKHRGTHKGNIDGMLRVTENMIWDRREGSNILDKQGVGKQLHRAEAN